MTVMIGAKSRDAPRSDRTKVVLNLVEIDDGIYGICWYHHKPADQDRHKSPVFIEIVHIPHYGVLSIEKKLRYDQIEGKVVAYDTRIWFPSPCLYLCNHKK